MRAALLLLALAIPTAQAQVHCRRSTGHCEKVDANDLALLERKMKAACQRR